MAFIVGNVHFDSSSYLGQGFFFIALCIHFFCKGMNPSILPPAMIK